MRKLPRCRSVLLHTGVFPVINHYYEPKFDYRSTALGKEQFRCLPGIEWNLEGQLELLKRMVFADELAGLDSGAMGDDSFSLNNDMFNSGDVEYWYQIIRLYRPRRIVEIGSGSSTLIARRAILQNMRDESDYVCEHVCVEPYGASWLDQQGGISIHRCPVENLEVEFFSSLDANDILFIDSSHVIRPGGDVLYELLQLLPSLKLGVIVHFHDIFTPADYPLVWLAEDVRLWNEQYLLEGFLTHNTSWQVIGALNYLHHLHPERLQAVAPYLTPDREPGSFYIRRVG